MLFYFIVSICKGTTILKYKYINNHFDKTTFQTGLYLFSLCWFFLFIHAPNVIVNIFKLSMHSLLVFRRRTNNIYLLFDQIKSSFVVGIIYPKSSNTYSMIDINRSVNNLNQRYMFTDVIKIKIHLFLFNRIILALFLNTICHNVFRKPDPIQITQWCNFFKYGSIWEGQ